MQFKGLFVGETCTGTGATQTLAGAYTLETGVDTIPFASAYSDGAIVPFVLLASNGVDRLEGQAVFDDAGTLTLSPWVIWNGTTYETYDGSGFTLPAGTHRIWVAAGSVTRGFDSFNLTEFGGTLEMVFPDNIVRAEGYANTEEPGSSFFSPIMFSSPVAFNRLAIRIGNAGAASSTVQAGIYRCRETTVFDAGCGLLGKALATAEFDATITGTQFVSTPQQILPPGRYWTGIWTEDPDVSLLRTEFRTHSGAASIWAYNSNGAAVLRLDGQTGLASDLTSESPYGRQSTRGYIVGLAYVPD
ncbi:hypothetical protein [Methylophaga sp.]|uniref:hypothetical protein n=1 Tax=Methylophaga sp. TaxID=2024840 RepID=UPI0025D865F6|nr:hypothetical protein [Methylophaga sp.]